MYVNKKKVFPLIYFYTFANSFKINLLHKYFHHFYIQCYVQLVCFHRKWHIEAQVCYRRVYKQSQKSGWTKTQSRTSSITVVDTEIINWMTLRHYFQSCWYAAWSSRNDETCLFESTAMYRHYSIQTVQFFCNVRMNDAFDLNKTKEELKV